MLQCPSCSLIVSFTSDKTNVISCACGKVLRLQDGQLSVTSIRQATINADFIIPGTKGKWQDKNFRVTGRLFTKGDDWVFNYWTILFDDGEINYLAEGYGSYAILKEIDTKEILNPFKAEMLRVNDYVELKPSETFYLIRKNQDVLIKTEGEILLPATSGKIKVFDFYSEAGIYLTSFFPDRNSIHYYNTVFTHFDELHLSNLKTISKQKTFTCLNCYQTLPAKSYPFAFSLSCAHCGTHHYFDEETDMLKKGDRNKLEIRPDMEIGSSGTINGMKFEVVGYSLKEENNSDSSQWKEYVLYSRAEGFAYLSEFQGHWIYVKEVARPPLPGRVNNEQQFVHNNNHYQLFNDYTYDVVSAIGEHPYDISKTAGYRVKEFISPPEVWIVEYNKNESNWFLGKHINHKEVLNNFTFPETKPVQYGVGMVQPTGMLSKQHFFLLMLITILSFIAIHILTGSYKKERTILEQRYSFDTSNTVTVTTAKFNLDKWESNMEFTISADVSNSWFELSGSLINADNGKEYSFEKGVEYYYGYTDGENWTEGKRSDEAYLTGITPGTYFLHFTGRREVLSNINNFSIRVLYDVRTDRNLVFSILLIAIVAAIQYFVFYYYNKKRWQNSRFSPYNYEH